MNQQQQDLKTAQELLSRARRVDPTVYDSTLH